jgi:hypothetical protein
VYELQVRQQVGSVILVEERHGVEHVEGVSVRQLHALEGALLRENLFDVGCQERVRGEEGLAQRALGGGFELLLGSALEAGVVMIELAFEDILEKTEEKDLDCWHTYSFLNILAV